MSCGGVTGYEPKGGRPGMGRPGEVNQSGDPNRGGHAGRPGGGGGPRGPGSGDIDGPGGQGTDGGPSPGGGGSSAGPGKAGGATGGPTTIGESGPGSATLDVGGAKVSIKGPGAEKYAQTLKDWTDKNPELKKMVQEAAKANPNGQFEINIKELGPGSTAGSTIAGLAPVGQKGQDVMQYGEVKIDTNNFSKNVLIHELLHNKGWNHGGAMDGRVNTISAMG